MSPLLVALLIDREPLAEGLRPEADFCRLEAEPSRFLSEKTPNNKINNLLKVKIPKVIYNPLVHSSYKKNVLPLSYTKAHLSNKQKQKASQQLK